MPAAKRAVLLVLSIASDVVVLKTQVLVPRRLETQFYNVLDSVLRHKILVLVSLWTLQALILGLGSSEACTKTTAFPKAGHLQGFCAMA